MQTSQLNDETAQAINISDEIENQKYKDADNEKECETESARVYPPPSIKIDNESPLDPHEGFRGGKKAKRSEKSAGLVVTSSSGSSSLCLINRGVMETDTPLCATPSRSFISLQQHFPDNRNENSLRTAGASHIAVSETSIGTHFPSLSTEISGNAQSLGEFAGTIRMKVQDNDHQSAGCKVEADSTKVQNGSIPHIESESSHYHNPKQAQQICGSVGSVTILPKPTSSLHSNSLLGDTIQSNVTKQLALNFSSQVSNEGTSKDIGSYEATSIDCALFSETKGTDKCRVELHREMSINPLSSTFANKEVSFSAPTATLSSSAMTKATSQNKPSASLRRGKWTAEEEAYVTQVIHDFSSGYLNAPAGTTLRSYLSSKLQCDPMRITKKYTGDACIGKRVFHPTVRSMNNSAAIDKAQVSLIFNDISLQPELMTNHSEGYDIFINPQRHLLY